MSGPGHPEDDPPYMIRSSPPPAARSLLYVEDEQTDGQLMRIAFRQEGLEGALRIVKDGKGALDYLSGAPPYADRQAFPAPAVVLLDLNLPEGSGFEVLKWIRTHPLHSTLPVVVFTASEFGADRARAALLGANEFISKPGSLPQVRYIVRQLNERWLSPQEETEGIERNR